MSRNVFLSGFSVVSSFFLLTLSAPVNAADPALSHLPPQLTTLSAKYYSPAKSAVGRIDLPTQGNVVIPSELPIVSGSTGLDFATVNFDDQYTCVYRGAVPLINLFGKKASKYEFFFCLPGKDNLDGLLKKLLSALKLKPGQSLPTRDKVLVEIHSGTPSEPTLVEAKFQIPQWIPTSPRTGQERATYLHLAKTKSGAAYATSFFVKENAFLTVPQTLENYGITLQSSHVSELTIDSGTKCRYLGAQLQSCRDSTGMPLAGRGFVPKKSLNFAVVSGFTGGQPIFARAPFSVKYGSVIAPPTLIVNLQTPILTKEPALSFPVTVLSEAPSIQTTVLQNGVQITQSNLLSFTVNAVLAEGMNTFEVRAVDSVGGSATRILSNIVLDRTAPVPSWSVPVADGVITSLDVPVSGTANEPLKSAVANGRDLKISGDGRSFSGVLPALLSGSFSIELTLTDLMGNVRILSRNVRIELPNEPALPPDPVAVAPELDPAQASDVTDSTVFLYTGANPIQTGVTEGTITRERGAVVRGKVILTTGQALPGVRVSVKDHPEYGQTITREDGAYDLALNGGEQVLLKFEKSQFLTAERAFTAPSRDYEILADVALTRLSTEVTQVAFGASDAQIARAETITDESGSRRATILFPSGTTAELVSPDGSTRQVANLRIRASEYTVGPNGPKAMPAVLPATSAYTYALELSADEALSEGAQSVTFSKPVYHYVENFLGFPVGMPVPAGYYDTARAVWVASDDGRVIKILGSSNGLAQVDINGAGSPATAEELESLGMTDEERAQLSTLYAADQTIWRTPIPHFSTWDLNLAWFSKNNPGFPPPEANSDSVTRCPCSTLSSGSIIDRQNQILREQIPITGTGMTLNYASDRAPNRKAQYQIRIPINSAQVPERRMVLEVRIAGQYHEYTFQPAPYQYYDFNWDGRDAYGRPVNAPVAANIRIGFESQGSYMAPAQGGRSFALASATPLTTSVTTRAIYVEGIRDYSVEVGAFDGRIFGLGGWSLSSQLYFNGETLYSGDGTKRSASSVSMRGVSNFLTNGVSFPHGLAFGKNDELYVSDFNTNQIMKFSSNGQKTVLLGNRNQPIQLQLSPDKNTLYAVEYGASRLLWMNLQNGSFAYIAGGGTLSNAAGPVLAAKAAIPGLHSVAAASDGTLYLAGTDEYGIHRLGTDGYLSRVPGTATTLAGQGDITALAVTPNGQTIYAGTRSGSVWRFTPSGTAARITTPSDEPVYAMTIGPDGLLYYGTHTGRIYRILNTDSILIAGGGTDSVGVALQVDMLGLRGLQFDRSGSLYASMSGRVVKISSTMPRALGLPLQVASEDGSLLYGFDASGKHLTTQNTYTGAIVQQYLYAPNRALVGIQDAFGNVTQIERAPNGRALAIISPYGARTDLLIDDFGYLLSVSNPNQETYSFEYHPGSSLLSQMTYPKGNRSRFVYDAAGRLTQDRNELGATQTLSRTEQEDGNYRVMYSTAEGISTEHSVALASDGTRTLQTVHPDGTRTLTNILASGFTQTTHPDGSFTETVQAADPRFGMEAAYTKSSLLRRRMGQTKVDTTTKFASSDGTNFTLNEITRRNGRQYSSIYQSSNRTSITVSPMGKQTSSVIDEFGRLSLTRTGVGALAATNFAYDERGRLASTTQSDRSTSLQYDAAGNLAMTENALGQVTAFEYDPAGRMTKQILPGAREVNYSYDPNGQMTSIQVPGGATHEFAYDSIGQEAEYSPPAVSGSGTTKYQYNLDGKVTRITRPDGSTIEYTYNPVTGKLSSVATVDGVTTYEYDQSTGQLMKVTVPQGLAGAPQVTTYTWDSHLLRMVASTGQVNGVLDVKRDSNEEKIIRYVTVFGSSQLTFSTSYSYDSDGLLFMNSLGTLTRNPEHGLLSGTTWLVNDFQENFTRNTFGEITSSLAKRYGTTLLSEQIIRDKLGRIVFNTVTDHESFRQFTYSYDTANRLRTIQEFGGPTTKLTYDQNGNRIAFEKDGNTTTATYDAQDRMLKHGSEDFTYNANGEMTSRKNTDTGETTAYRYNPFGQLRSATLPNGTQVDYIIDDQGRRLGKKVNGAMKQMFLYEGPLELTAEMDGDGNAKSFFIYGAKAHVPDFMIKKAEFVATREYYRIVSDQRGSVRYVLDVGGTIVQEIDYDDFGNVIKDTNPGFQPFGFAGGLYDPDTKLTHFGAREYDASTGRWTTKDPIRFVGGLNLYGYVMNDPINQIDPSGLRCTLNQATGTTLCYDDRTGDLNNYQRGYTGGGSGKNNPAMQDVENTGPVPQGTYQIGPSIDTDLSKSSRQLNPTDETRASFPPNRKPNSFWIHGDNPATVGSSSNGCPIINGIRNRNSFPTGEYLDVVNGSF